MRVCAERNQANLSDVPELSSDGMRRKSCEPKVSVGVKLPQARCGRDDGAQGMSGPAVTPDPCQKPGKGFCHGLWLAFC
jgi:hypothetical protein